MTIEILNENPPASPHNPAPRPIVQAMMRGLGGRCPACGVGRLFQSYLKVADACAECGEELHHHRADDAPPYFTIFLVGHIIVPLLLVSEKLWHPPLWVHMMTWLPATLILSVLLLPAVKGGVVALQWAQRMHGFEYAAQCQAAHIKKTG